MMTGQPKKIIPYITKTNPLRIVVIYGTASMLWFLLSDYLFALLPPGVGEQQYTQPAKYFFYVSFACLLLYPLLKQCIAEISESESQLKHKNEKLLISNQELEMAEDELRRQLDTLINNQDVIRRQNEYLFSLHDIALTLMNRLNMNDFLKLVVQQAAKLVDTSHSFITIFDDENCGYRYKVATGLYQTHTIPFLQLDDKLNTKVCKLGQPVVINDYPQKKSPLAEPEYVQAIIYLPLKSGPDVLGVIGLARTARDGQFCNDDIMALSWFSELSSIALDNVHLYAAAQEELAERRRVQAAAQKSEAKMRALLRAIPDMMFRFNSDGVVLEMTVPKNTSFSEFPSPPNSLVGKNLTDFVPPELSAKTLQAIQKVLETENMQLIEYQLHQDPVPQHLEARFVPCGNNDVLAIVRNITELKNLLQRLTYLGMYDTLTGLYNRAQFEKDMRRLNSDVYAPVGIIVGDVDGLKLINDTLGHASGDILLQQAANVLKHSFDANTSISRIGGDEFAILLPKTTMTQLEEACQRIRGNETAYNAEYPDFPLSISLGMALSADKNINIDELFSEADNKMYREKIQRSKHAHSAIFQGIAISLESRDFAAQGHIDKLKHVTEKLATALRLPKKAIRDLHLLAQFHDIGKVVTPEHILYKKGRLTNEEYEEMKRHTENGYRIARAIPSLAPIAEWIVKHHEWWNGSGYPFGLKADEIPLECRILAIADAYDAMTSDRPYRRAMSHEAALAEIMKYAGEQFDPRLVDKFTKLLFELEQ